MLIRDDMQYLNDILTLRPKWIDAAVLWYKCSNIARPMGIIQKMGRTFHAVSAEGRSFKAARRLISSLNIGNFLSTSAKSRHPDVMVVPNIRVLAVSKGHGLYTGVAYKLKHSWILWKSMLAAHIQMRLTAGYSYDTLNSRHYLSKGCITQVNKKPKFTKILLTWTQP